jgi:hypothetical protein
MESALIFFNLRENNCHCEQKRKNSGSVNQSFNQDRLTKN